MKTLLLVGLAFYLNPPEKKLVKARSWQFMKYSVKHSGQHFPTLREGFEEGYAQGVFDTKTLSPRACVRSLSLRAGKARIQKEARN